ncbi:LLM class flavin-dependent oxidoreductase [Streptomyces sp. SID13726]|uniref:LLM class flavin-dependent oxidoreductase n=1 Tax=Streptomyces sp. SID13726 TaxID=2706058 RepID=UPI0013B5C8E1|nr:LLM class flavin-dependent oxidoreductase [Streptomyces sp. SID13726]NEB02737.1 LLM class flavin-dependent oxidoreductase [Streptomyces sp. SID13726]
MTRLRSALWLPLFDGLADPMAVARLAAEAEEAGWDGVFVWDHLRWRAPVGHVADPWITLTAIATATERLRFGPMVTPLARRRPAKVAKETATLDRLSGGRLTLGVGLGSDRFAGELSATGEELDDRLRGEMLDESLEILTAAWSGRPVHHHGRHYTVDGVSFLPRPVQLPGVPVWAAGFPGKAKPMRRAARHDGFFPVNLEHPDQLADVVATLTDLRRQETTPYDVAVPLPPGTDPTPFAEAGATWWLAEFDPEEVSLDQVRGVIHDGPVDIAVEQIR